MSRVPVLRISYQKCLPGSGGLLPASMCPDMNLLHVYPIFYYNLPLWWDSLIAECFSTCPSLSHWIFLIVVRWFALPDASIFTLVFSLMDSVKVSNSTGFLCTWRLTLLLCYCARISTLLFLQQQKEFFHFLGICAPFVMKARWD